MLMASTTDEQVYAFRDRLSEHFPSQVNADITEVCNLACIHCPHPAFKVSEHYGARYLDPALNEKMVDEVASTGKGHTQYIRYASNGEPLVHPNGYDMIEHAVKYSGVFVTLTTNGTLMNERRMQRLLSAGVHMIDISIDAFKDETYSKIRVNGDLHVTRSNVLRLLRWTQETKASTRVVVSFVEQAENKGEAESFERYWTDQGAAGVVIRRLHSCAGSKIELAALRRQLQAKESKRRPCLYPWERVVLNARGDLAFCPTDWVHGSVLANYGKTTIAELWSSETFRELRHAHLTNEFSKHKFCGQCPDWEQTRWPGDGRSYADLVEELATQQ